MQENVNNVVTDEIDENTYFSQTIESFGTLVWKRFRKHKLAMFGSVVIIIVLAMTIFAPLVTPYGPEEMHLDEVINGKPLPPSSKYVFGTDNFGRDYFTRCVYGGRVSLMVGFCAIIISVIIGVTLGCTAGYYGGIVDMLICRIMDILTCIPTFFSMIIVSSMLGMSTFNLIAVLGILGWMGIARQIRAQFLSLRSQEFVQAAVALGLRDRAIVFKHLLQNGLTPVIVSATMGIAGNIMAESALSYLGLGVQEPTASWGSMLRASQAYITTAPWLGIAPGAFISIVALALNFMGDGLRDALDPRTTKI